MNRISIILEIQGSGLQFVCREKITCQLPIQYIYDHMAPIRLLARKLATRMSVHGEDSNIRWNN